VSDEWKMVQDQFYNGAERKSRGQRVELIFDDCGLEVYAESGSAYNSSSERVYIPTTVLLNLLRHAGSVFTTLLASALIYACAPAPWEQKYGYYLDRSPNYDVNPVVTPGGVRYDGEVDVEQLDFLTNQLESCLERSIDRSSFVVKIPNDWTYSCDGTEEVLPFVSVFDKTCKGQTATETCPCRYRAVLQEPNVVVVTPNLKLYRDALTRLLLNTTNPWSNPEISPCL
jgi:hypothetical protein